MATQDGMRIGEAYRGGPVAGQWDAIVIGSGIGGLAAGVLLGRHGGRRVLVLERHYTAGGFTHVFRRPGYEWDVGVHYLGEMHPGGMMRGLFDHLSDGELAWADMGEVYDRVAIGGTTYDLPRGRERLAARLTSYFPEEGEAIRRYLALVGETARASLAFFSAKALPPLLAPFAQPFARRRFLRLAGRTTRETLETLTRDQRLIGLLTAQWGDYGLPPAESSFGMHALVAQHYMDGAAYPVGGASRIAGTIVPAIERARGRVLVHAEVDEILVDGGRAVGVRLAGGAVVRAPLVISDAGLATTVRRLLPREAAARTGLEAALARARPSTAHVCLYVGLRRPADDLGLPRANLWVYPDEHHERTVAEAHAAPDTPRAAYVSFPSAKDPDFARRHPGRATIEVATFIPYAHFARWQDARWQKRGPEYDAVKARLANHLLELLVAHVPQVRGQVDVCELSTPLSTRHFVNHASGEIYGLDHTPARFRNRALRPQTPLRGLWLTGADVATAGVAGALLGGVLCASALLRRNLLDAIRREVAAGTRDAA